MYEPTARNEVAVYDVAALRALEAQAARDFGDAFELMRRAGQAAWQALLAQWSEALHVVVVCGPGRNGGDGYVLATHAVESGRSVRVVRMADHRPRDPLGAQAERAYMDAGGAIVEFAGQLPHADVIVDALFGIGLSRAPEAGTAALIDAINRHDGRILSLDVPSGVDAERGAVPGIAVEATRTLEFLLPKRGLRTGRALDHVGMLSLAQLGVEAELRDARPPAGHVLVPDHLELWLPQRARDSHKGDHGRVLCIGGDHGSGGAILLTVEAALRSGAGLVDVATRDAHVAAAITRLPEAMARGVDDASRALDAAGRADVIAIGPGLGTGDWGAALLDVALAAPGAKVLDADALNLLARAPRALSPDAVLTPHPGEAARLLGVAAADVQADRLGSARELAERFDAVVVLKGAGTIVAAPGAVPRLIGAGNPGMAVGGMGDVLTGVVAAMRAQGFDAFDAAAVGALLHAAAGDAAAQDEGERGLLPTDVMPWLRRFANPDIEE